MRFNTLPLPPVSASLLLAIYFYAFLSVGIHTLGDPDTGWHIAAGDLIRAQGHLPAHDPWSFTAGEFRWFNLAWAWDAAISWLHEIAGLSGVIVYACLSGALLIALTYGWLLMRGAGGIAAFLSVFLLALVAMSGLYARPQLITFLLMLAFAWIAQGVATHRLRPKLLSLLPYLMAAWVNLHGGFIIGLTVPLVYLIVAMAQRQQAMRLYFALTLAGCLAMTLLNPYGIHVYEGVARTLGSALASIIGEWQPLRLDAAGWPAMLLLLLFVALVRPTDTRFHPAERALAWLWAIATLIAARNAMIFAIVALPMFALRLREVMEASPRREAVPAVEHLAEYLGSLLALRCSRAVVLGVALTCMALSFHPAVQLRYFGSHVALPPAMESSIAYLRQHHAGERFLNLYDFGGALIYGARGEIPLFIDSRAETVYPPEVVQDYLSFHRGDEGWEKIFEKYKLKGIVGPSGNYRPAIADRLRARVDLRRVHQGETVDIYLYRPNP